MSSFQRIEFYCSLIDFWSNIWHPSQSDKTEWYRAIQEVLQEKSMSNKPCNWLIDRKLALCYSCWIDRLSTFKSTFVDYYLLNVYIDTCVCLSLTGNRNTHKDKVMWVRSIDKYINQTNGLTNTHNDTELISLTLDAICRFRSMSSNQWPFLCTRLFDESKTIDIYLSIDSEWTQWTNKSSILNTFRPFSGHQLICGSDTIVNKWWKSELRVIP